MKNFLPKIFKDDRKTIIVFRGLCKGCGFCLEKCPQGAISFSRTELGYYSTPSVKINLKKCLACGVCEIVCPDSAIKVKGRK